MNLLRLSALRRLWPAILAISLWAGLPALSWAAPGPNQPAPSDDSHTGDWVMMYALVLLGVGLGMMVVVRTARRQDRAKVDGGMASMTPDEVQAAMAASRPGAKAQVRRGPEVAPEAKAALNMAIAGAIIPVVGLGLGPFAAWKAIQARKLIKETAHLTGDGVAVAALSVGIAGGVIGLIWLIVLLVSLFR